MTYVRTLNEKCNINVVLFTNLTSSVNHFPTFAVYYIGRFWVSVLSYMPLCLSVSLSYFHVRIWKPCGAKLLYRSDKKCIRYLWSNREGGHWEMSSGTVFVATQNACVCVCGGLWGSADSQTRRWRRLIDILHGTHTYIRAHTRLQKYTPMRRVSLNQA